MASEGLEVARWLAAHGVAAFVLKYRLVPTPPTTEDFMAQVQRIFVDPLWVRALAQRYAPLAIADGRQAVTLMRQHAAEWGIAPDRIGMLGFSAGGRVTAGVALEHDECSRPDFAAVIYGALWDKLDVPSDAPPLFVLVANDDAIAVGDSLDLFAAWRSAGHPVDLHVFSEGGHGFGMNQQGLPSDNWNELFASWLGVVSYRTSAVTASR
jgi:acetyl esterase/lipase